MNIGLLILVLEGLRESNGDIPVTVKVQMRNYPLGSNAEIASVGSGEQEIVINI